MPVTLVGAGCGSPRLLTVAARECVSRAAHIVYDRLIHPDILQLAPADCRFHLVGKRENIHTLSQDGINELLVSLGREGRDVVRLKGGDPFVFGRGGEEVEVLERAGIPWSAIPGITSAIGGALCCGLPATHRDAASSVTLATGHRRFDPAKEDEESFWREIASISGTVALYMGASAFADISENLLSFGKSADTPMSVVAWGGWGRAKRIDGTLAEIGGLAGAEGLPSPAIIYVGGASGIKLSPAQGDLKGLQVQICRPFPECWSTGRALEEMGADCYGLPLLALEPLQPEDADEAKRTIESADWLILTSPRGPRELRRIVKDLRSIHGKIVALGEGTSNALRDIGLISDYTANGTSESLAVMLNGLVRSGESVVFTRNERGSHVAVQAARERGATVTSLSTYRMLPREIPGIEVMREQWQSCGVDAVVFGSAALVEEYARRLGPPPANAELIAWGSVCAEAVENCFARKPLKLPQPDMDGLIEVLKNLKQYGIKPKTCL